MNIATLAPAERAIWMSRLTILAIPLAAFLGFIIQLLLAKHLLPLYGGTPAVWLGSSLYFQLTLVLGYGWAVWLLSRSTYVQAGSTVLLAVVALLTFHLPGTAAEQPSVALVVGRLALGSLPAMILLFSVAPLLHGWVARHEGKLPYHLYALSNAGSLLALVAYPFLIEPSIGLALQSQSWKVLLHLLVALLAIASGILWFNATPLPASEKQPDASGLPWTQLAAWLGLSALGVVHLLAATQQIAGEIGSTPLAWAGPLGLYLLGFTLVFSGRWQSWMTHLCIALLAVALAAYMQVKGFTAATISGSRLGWLLAASATGGIIGSALLHHLRPQRRPELFYLAMGVGGMLGGLASTYVVPSVFAMPVEFTFTSLALLIVGLAWVFAGSGPQRIGLLALVVAAPVLTVGVHQLTQSPPGLTGLHLRDVTGGLLLEFSPAGVVISSETTTHGSQLTADEATRRRPTLYYTESSGVGRVITKLQATHPSLRYGVIGLGAGTLAAYTRPDDICDFWDIDPKALSVANEHFSYLRDARGKVNVTLRDGRQALQHSTIDYNLLVIDAFQGDYIPTHLLTREALQIYAARLVTHRGLLLIHASVRHADYFPAVEATARSLGLAAMKITTQIESATDSADLNAAVSDYILICRPDRFFELAFWFPDEEDNGRVKHVVRHEPAPSNDPSQIWTDDRSSTLQTIDLGAWIKGD